MCCNNKDPNLYNFKRFFIITHLNFHFLFVLDSCLSDAKASADNNGLVGGYTELTDAPDEVTQVLADAVLKNHLQESNRLTSIDLKITKIYGQVRD